MLRTDLSVQTKDKLIDLLENALRPWGWKFRRYVQSFRKDTTIDLVGNAYGHRDILILIEMPEVLKKSPQSLTSTLISYMDDPDMDLIEQGDIAHAIARTLTGRSYKDLPPQQFPLASWDDISFSQIRAWYDVGQIEAKLKDIYYYASGRFGPKDTNVIGIQFPLMVYGDEGVPEPTSDPLEIASIASTNLRYTVRGVNASEYGGWCNAPLQFLASEISTISDRRVIGEIYNGINAESYHMCNSAINWNYTDFNGNITTVKLSIESLLWRLNPYYDNFEDLKNSKTYRIGKYYMWGISEIQFNDIRRSPEWKAEVDRFIIETEMSQYDPKVGKAFFPKDAIPESYSKVYTLGEKIQWWLGHLFLEK